ncbi:MAG: hypothetical protein ACXABK_01580, partial [Candidatus Heimdallarchaeaceae archaeon]
MQVEVSSLNKEEIISGDKNNMSLYETLWKNERNRTLLISSIVAITCLIIAILLASVDSQSAPNWIKGL